MRFFTRITLITAALAMFAVSADAERFGLVLEKSSLSAAPPMMPDEGWITDGTHTDTRRENQVRFGTVLSGSVSDDEFIVRYYILSMSTLQPTVTKVYTYTPVPGNPDMRNVDFRKSSTNRWGYTLEVGFMEAGNPNSPAFWKRFIPGAGFMAGFQYVHGETPDLYVGYTPNIHILGPSFRLNMELYRTGEGFFPRSGIGLIIW